MQCRLQQVLLAELAGDGFVCLFSICNASGEVALSASHVIVTWRDRICSVQYVEVDGK